MNASIPLCQLRIWCRRNDAWLSFKTVAQDRYLINPLGYFLELPEGSLTAISPRVTFPLVDALPSVPLGELVARKQYAADALFISVPMSGQGHDPVVVPVEELMDDGVMDHEFANGLNMIESYILTRAVENGLVAYDNLDPIIALYNRGNSVGEALLKTGVCNWEGLLSYCLDVRPPSRLDPPNLRTLVERSEWELTGEILISLDKINRTELEHALKMKRDGNQALGQILTAMGACKQADIDECLRIQQQIRNADADGVVLIGNLLVQQGFLSADDLEEALRSQRVARQPLGRILISMGACTQKDLDHYEHIHGHFQQQVDETSMATYFVQTETITRTQLDEALRVQQRGRQVLGEIIVAMGLCNRAAVEAVAQIQREVRDHYQSGLHRLGDLLIRKGFCTGDIVEEAINLQTIGRQPFGAILVAMGACTADDVKFALEIQRKWRSRGKPLPDRLGEVLVRNGVISEETLHEPLKRHVNESKPLGRILIESGICKPEHIIEALIHRDAKRQEDFYKFVRGHIKSELPEPVPEPAVKVATGEQDTKASLVDKISAWIPGSKRKTD